jgi:hypothetical protein
MISRLLARERSVRWTISWPWFSFVIVKSSSASSLVHGTASAAPSSTIRINAAIQRISANGVVSLLSVLYHTVQ